MMTFASKTPPAKLKQQILSKLELKETKIIPLETKKPSFSFWLAAASLALLIVSGISIFTLKNKLNSAEEQLTELSFEKEKYVTDFETQSASYKTMAEEMAVVMQPDNKKIVLKGMGPAPEAIAAVYWNQNTKDVYINVTSLPTPSADQQYQLWAIVDGKPVDAGIFDMDFNSLHKMKTIEGAQAFAVTLEKKGGSPTPTMTAMYLMGNV